MLFNSVLLFFVISIVNAQVPLRNVFDDELYINVLDRELCEQQLTFLATNISSLPFFDAGIRFPRGVLKFNLQDWGNYHQCLGINQDSGTVGTIEGKYCSINVPLQLNIGGLTWLDTTIENLELDEGTLKNIEHFEKFKRQLNALNGRSLPDSEIGQLGLSLNLAICIPKVCTSAQVIEFMSPTDGEMLFKATETFCRLPNDKPFAPADYVAMVFCGIFGVLIILSTTYDIHHNVINQRNRKDKTNTLCCSFSLYTNTVRLLTFNYGPNALQCVDGIRSIAMLWVIIGHGYSSALGFISNPATVMTWLGDFESVWIISGPITVDTFFFLSGLLVVYTTVGKLTTRKFLKNIHMFYLLRYLRLFPILAATILFQASLVHHMADGPAWRDNMAGNVQICRDGWWWPLLYVANYMNLDYMCLGVVWYLCVDMQLFWVSPLVLVWVLSGSRLLAWLALGIALFMSLLSTSLYSFIYQLPSSFLSINNLELMADYFKLYYINTLARGGPFFVGMIFGYLLHVYRNKEIHLNKILVGLAWILSMAIFAFVIFIHYTIAQPDYDNKIFDGFINSYSRSLWALGLGWLIFACAHGYGEPINWFLSLNMWKLPARLSYAMYLIHMTLISLGLSSLVHQIHFSAAGLFYRFLADLVLTFIVSFILTLAIDSPFSTLQKLLLGDGPKKKPSTEIKEPNNENNIVEKPTTSLPEKVA